MLYCVCLLVLVFVYSLLSQQSDETQVLKVLGLMVNLSSSKEVCSMLGCFVLLKFSLQIVDIFTAYNKQLLPVLLSYLGTGSEAMIEQVSNSLWCLLCAACFRFSVFFFLFFLTFLQILMLVSNLSDGPCETKDILAESELLMRKLAELLVSIVYNNGAIVCTIPFSNILKQASRYLLHVSKL